MVYIYALRQGKKVVYVGQSKNLKRRVSNHKSDKLFDNYIILHELENPTREEVWIAEDFFIMKYNPIYNKTLNRGLQYYSIDELCEMYSCKKQHLNKWFKLYKVKPLFKDKYTYKDTRDCGMFASGYGTPKQYEKFREEQLKKEMGLSEYERLVMRGRVL